MACIGPTAGMTERGAECATPGGMHKFGVRLPPDRSHPDAVVRRLRNRMISLDKSRLRKNVALRRELKSLDAQYGKQLAALMGTGGSRRYRELREETRDAPRSRRIRAANKILTDIGVDRARVERLQRDYLEAGRKLLEVALVPPPRTRFPHHDDCTPWVIHTAPYNGYFWSYSWERSDEADDPVLARYLDPVSGQIGSSIRTRVSGADDDDSISADYYTSLNAWHTALETGALEGYLVFEFRRSTYSGDISDEFGFSSVLYTQAASARMRVLDAQALLDHQESQMFGFTEFLYCEEDLWKKQIAVPRDFHWYYFRTGASFNQGSTVLLEAGIMNTTWFKCNDYSVTIEDDIELRLDRLMVRTCPAAPIL